MVTETSNGFVFNDDGTVTDVEAEESSEVVDDAGMIRQIKGAE